MAEQLKGLSPEEYFSQYLNLVRMDAIPSIQAAPRIESHKRTSSLNKPLLAAAVTAGIASALLTTIALSGVQQFLGDTISSAQSTIDQKTQVALGSGCRVSLPGLKGTEFDRYFNVCSW